MQQINSSLMKQYNDNLFCEQVILLPFMSIAKREQEFIVFFKDLYERTLALPKKGQTWNNFFLPMKKAVITMDFFTNYLSNFHSSLGIEEAGIFEATYKIKDIIKKLHKNLYNSAFLIKSMKSLLISERFEKRKKIINVWLDTFFNISLSKKDKRLYQNLSENLEKKTKLFESNSERALERQKAAIFVPQQQKYKLKGLSEEVLKVGKYNANIYNKKGWLFFSDDVTSTNLLEQASNRCFRKKVFEFHQRLNSGFRTKENNDLVLREILSLKQQISAIYNKDNYAELVLSNYVLDSSDKAYDYLGNIERQLKGFMINIEADMKEKSQENKIVQLKKWDVPYYYGKVMKDLNNYSVEIFQEYFVYETFLPKFQKFLLKEFDLSMTHVKTELINKNEVNTYKMIDNKTGKQGYFCISPFANASKTGAYQIEMLAYEKCGHNEYSCAIEYISLEFEKEKEKTPMHFIDVLVFLHEFGHALHAFFANKEDSKTNETLVSWDLIELPSQFLEHLIYDYNFMRSMSSCDKNGKKISKKTLKNVIQKMQFCSAYETYQEIKKYSAQLWLHETFKPYSKKSPQKIFNEKLGNEGLVYNINRDGFMLNIHHLTDYAPAGYVYLYSANIAYNLITDKKRNLRETFTDLFNSDKMERLDKKLSLLMDLNKFDMNAFIRKGWNIKLYGDK